MCVDFLNSNIKKEEGQSSGISSGYLMRYMILNGPKVTGLLIVYTFRKRILKPKTSSVHFVCFYVFTS